MTCNKANAYFIKYIDSCLSEEDRKKLDSHLEECKPCKKDFSAYSEIMKEFELNELTKAPLDFTEQVMLKVSEIEPKWLKQSKLREKLSWVSVSVFTSIFTLFAVLLINAEKVSSLTQNYPRLSSVANSLIIIGNATTNFMQSFVNTGSSIIGFISTYQFLVLGIAVLLFFMPIMIQKTEKVLV